MSFPKFKLAKREVRHGGIRLERWTHGRHSIVVDNTPDGIALPSLRRTYSVYRGKTLLLGIVFADGMTTTEQLRAKLSECLARTTPIARVKPKQHRIW